MLAGRPWDEWISRYEVSHRHPVNRLCHTLGIPLIVLSLPLYLAAWLLHGMWPGLWLVPTALFLAGWILQFAGHLVEGKRPEFFHDWRFLLVGLRWWTAKVRGRL